MSVHVCRLCGEQVDVSEAGDNAESIAALLMAHVRLGCTALNYQDPRMEEAVASAELAGAEPEPEPTTEQDWRDEVWKYRDQYAQHWASLAAQHFQHWDLVSMGGVVLNTHHERLCRPPCCIHSPSEHHMRQWPQHWSQPMGVVFRQCPHGEMHPDPDDLKARTGLVLHRCDGCCLSPRV